MKKILLNKTDKCFVISSIMCFSLLALILILLFCYIFFKINPLLQIILPLTFAMAVLILPINLILLIITLFIKAFSKNKSMKDSIIIFFNTISIFILGIIWLVFAAPIINSLY